MNNTLSIAIIGAGIGGLAAAALLARAGHDVAVFDQFEAPRPVGSGLVIQPVGQRVLELAGAFDAARAMGNPIRRMLGHEAQTGARVLDVWYDRASPGTRFGLAIHRAALFESLLSAARSAGASLTPSKTVTQISDGSVQFDTGAVAGPFDLTIDASGANSRLSGLVAKPLPYGAIWGTVAWPDTELPKDQLSQSYRRADRMLGVLPIGQLPGEPRQLASVFWSMPSGAYESWQDQPLETWRKEATQLWPDFAPFIEQITRHDQMTMARYAHGTLRNPTGPCHAMIGDAAHRASPQLGQGANMALLDAAALALALKSAPVDLALRHYAQARRWHTRLYQAMSWAFTPQYQSDSRILPLLRDRVLFPASQLPPVPRVLTKLVCGDLLPPLASLTQDHA